MAPERVIVLAPSPMAPDGLFPNFLGGLYLGGQVRLEAAAKLLEKQPTSELTLVFMPLAAEELLGVTIESIVGDRQGEYVARLEQEQQGLAQLALGMYRDGCLYQNLEALRSILTRSGPKLLTEGEIKRSSEPA